jgi:hypothetical protein
VTFYQSIPVTVEAKRFDGHGDCGMDILRWLNGYGVRTAWLHAEDSNGPVQLDLCIPHVKIAEAGDYVVRIPNANLNPGSAPFIYRVMTEDQFKATYELKKGE